MPVPYQVFSCMGKETEHRISLLSPGGVRLPEAEEPRLLINAMREHYPFLPESGLSDPGMFLGNGFRVYRDCGRYLEMATPPCRTPEELCTYTWAGHRLLQEAMTDVAQHNAGVGAIHASLCTTDYLSCTTRGAHESYTYIADKPVGLVGQAILPFLVSRPCLSGAGGLDIGVSHHPRFVLSPRALFMTEVVGDQSTERRPIIHHKDERWTDNPFYHRYHCMIGENLCSHLGQYLQFGTTGLMVTLAAAGVIPANGGPVELMYPLSAFHTVTRDVTLTTTLPLANGRGMTALQLQQYYLDLALQHLDAAFMPSWASAVCAQWQRVLTALIHDPASLDTVLDWRIKKVFFDEFLAEHGSRFSPTALWQKMAELDFRFSQLGTAEGLFFQLDSHDALTHRLTEVTDDGINAAMRAAPAPAEKLGACVRLFYERPGAILNWRYLTLPNHDPLDLPRVSMQELEELARRPVPFVPEPASAPAPKISTVQFDVDFFHARMQDLSEMHAELRRIRRQHDRTEEACYLIDLGDCYRQDRAYQKALRYHRQALALWRQLEDTVQQAQALQRCGADLTGLGQYDAARASYEEGLRLVEALASPRPSALAPGMFYGNLGEVALRQGDAPTALPLLQRALELDTARGDQQGVMVDCINLCHAYLMHADLPQASDYGDRAMTLATECRDPRYRGICAAHQGRIATETGALDHATALLQEAADTAFHDDDNERFPLQLADLARVQFLQGIDHEAEANLEEALEVARHAPHPDHRGEYRALLVRGEQELYRGDSADARGSYSAALRCATKLKDRQGQARAHLGLGLVFHTQRNTPRAIYHYNQVLVSGLPWATYPAAIHLGMLYLKMGRSEEAATLIDRGMALCDLLLGRTRNMWSPRYYRALGHLLRGRSFIDPGFGYAISLCNAPGVLRQAQHHLKLITWPGEAQEAARQVTGLLENASRHDILAQLLARR